MSARSQRLESRRAGAGLVRLRTDGAGFTLAEFIVDRTWKAKLLALLRLDPGEVLLIGGSEDLLTGVVAVLDRAGIPTLRMPSSAAPEGVR